MKILFIGGVVWNLTDSIKLQVWDYYYDEILNGLYGRFDYAYTCNKEFTFTTNVKYLDQRDVGGGLFGDLGTYMAGGDIGIAGYGAKLTTFYGAVGDDSILNPFGGDYVVLMQTKWLERADEEVWGIKFDYNFERLGVKGLCMYVFYANFDTPDTGDNLSTDMQETDFNLQYTFSGWLEDLSLRFRYAHMDQDENVSDGNDWDDESFNGSFRDEC